MINIRLADLILEHGEALFPYLKMVCLNEKQGSKEVLVVKEQEFPETTLKLFRDSGFISYHISDGYTSIQLKKDGKWLCEPPEHSFPTRRNREEYVPKGLSKVADTIGYPADWVGNLGKYRKLFFLLTKSFQEDIIIKVAEYSKKSKMESTLGVFLSKKGFLYHKNVMDNPSKYSEDRCDLEGYEQFEPDPEWLGE